MWTGFRARFLSKLYSNSYQVEPGRLWLATIILLAILLRVGAACYLGDRVVELPGTFDQVSYDMLAQRVLDGHGFTVAKAWWPATRAGEPTAHWSYLYTLYLVAVYGLFGYHPLIARLIQAALAGWLMPWLAYRLGRRHFSSKAGLVAAGLTGCYLYFVYYAAALMTETFYITAILWTLDLAGQLGQPSKRSSDPQLQNSNFELQTQNSELRTPWLPLGLALAVTVLLRQVFLLFIPVLFAWLLWRSYRHQARPVLHMMGIMVAAGLILILTVVPWTLRNYQAFDKFVLLNTNAGFAFFWGNHPIHGYNFISILPADGPSYKDLIPAELRDLNEAELDQALLKRSIAFIQADPGRYFILSLSRVKDYFKFWPSSDSGLISNVSRLFSFALLLPFMAYGFVRNLPRSYLRETAILYLFVITYIAIHLLSWALIRYRLPVDALLLVFAGATLVEIQSKLSQRRAKTQHTFTPASLHSQD